MDEFAKRLTQLRSKKGITKKDLAKVLHVSAPCISQYERGSSMPGVDILCRLSQYFGVSIDFLVGNDNTSLRLADAFSGNTTYMDLLMTCAALPQEKKAMLLDLIQVIQHY